MIEQHDNYLKQLNELELKIKRNHYTSELSKLLNYDRNDNYELIIEVLESLKGCEAEIK